MITLGQGDKMTERKVVIMRGPSGSGKSTFRKNHFPDAFVCSADFFFYDKEGKYEFKPQLIGAAHESCKKTFKKALRAGEPLIVVDNTNTKMWEMKPYIQAAKQAGYDVEFVRLSTPVDVAAARNVHGVPLDAVKRMADRMEDLPPDLARKEKVVEGVS